MRHKIINVEDGGETEDSEQMSMGTMVKIVMRRGMRGTMMIMGRMRRRMRMRMMMMRRIITKIAGKEDLVAVLKFKRLE